MPEPIAGTALPQSANPCLVHFVEDESGQDVIEYALLASMVAFGSVAGTANIADKVANSFSDLSSSITNATSASTPSAPTSPPPAPAPPQGGRGRRGGGNGGFGGGGGGHHHRFF